MLEFAVKKTVPLTANVSPEARDLLYRFAGGLVDGGERLPLGRVLTAMILDFEEMGNWVEIEDNLRKEFEREKSERRKRDRERKRKKD